MTREPFPAGKLPPVFLQNLLKKVASQHDKRIIAGPGIGKDTAVIAYTDRYGVFTTDPITFATDQIGYYAVHVNANDIYTSGADPLYFLPTVLLPEGKTNEQILTAIFNQIHETCKALDIAVIGGHTEVTSGIERPIIAGTMYGEVKKQNYIGDKPLKPNDVVILAGPAAIEATAIIAREKETYLKEKGYAKASITTAKEFLFTPGISIAKAAKIARKYEIKRMHDPTEGGVAVALWEIAENANVGMKINKGSIPVNKISREICELFSIDPLHVISSGALIIICGQETLLPLLRDLKQHHIEASHIGQILNRSYKPALSSKNSVAEPLYPTPDQITKIF